ncbi:MAG: phage capsid protein [Clostridiaceae bacterium]|jgi:hypothetical protein|nr:phage capsid protein [Clostridiaceae bacterium]
MPNIVNYAHKWEKDIIKLFNQNALTSPFITSKVVFTGAKTVHFTQMGVTGYKTHSRQGGWNTGTVNQADNEFTLTHDRDIQFYVDIADIDESNETMSMKNVSDVFLRTQAVPEQDALFFGKVATVAVAEGLNSSTDISSYTKENVYGRLTEVWNRGKLRLYRQRGTLITYVNSTIMNLIEQSTNFTRVIKVESVSDMVGGIETRIARIDGIPVIEVIDDNRFYSSFNFTEGFEPQESACKINILVAATDTVKAVNKIANIYTFAPGAHHFGDGYLYQNRAYSDVFVFPNGVNNEIDSVAVDLSLAESTGE